MAALNISYELLQASEQTGLEEAAPGGDSVNRLARKLDDALYQLRQMEIR